MSKGVNVVVAGGKISEMALHFLNKAGIMAVRLQSKFDIRRLCKVTGAVPLPILVSNEMMSRDFFVYEQTHNIIIINLHSH